MDKATLESITGLSVEPFGETPPLPDQPIYSATISATPAFDTWTALKAKLQPHGYRPVFVGGAPDQIASVVDTYDINQNHSVVDALEWADKLTVEEWLHKRRELDPEIYDLDEAFEWPEGVSPSSGFFFTADVLTNRPHDQLALVFVPTAQSWQAPTILRYGGWNDCPAPEDHARIWRHWEQQYGAEIVSIGSDTIEAMVAQPPTTREAAMTLATEQFVYCSDIVHQGVGSVEALAATLLNGSTWYFWWD